MNNTSNTTPSTSIFNLVRGKANRLLIAVKAWPRGRKIFAATATGVLITACVSGGYIGIAHATHNTALETAKTAATTLAHTVKTNQERADELQTLITATTAYQAGTTALVVNANGFVDLAALETVSTENTNLGALLQTDPQPFLVNELGVVDASHSVDHLNAVTKTTRVSIDAITRDTTTKTETITSIAQKRTNIEDLLHTVAPSAPTVAETLLAAAPSADQPSRDALITSLTALATATIDRAPLTEPINTYVAAMKAAQASHAAVEEQKAITAAQQTNNPTYTNPTTGENRPNPNYNNRRNSSSNSGGRQTNNGGTAPQNRVTPAPGNTAPDVSVPEFKRDTKRYVRTNSYYTPGCDGFDDGWHDPGDGGTSNVTVDYPWDYRIEGDRIYFTMCG